MFTIRSLWAAPAVLALTAAACSTEVGHPEGSENVSQASTSCSATWGQCGGQGWTGATCCASGSSCQYSNQYYSQCIPTSGAGGGNGSSCPNGSQDAQQRAAASAAFAIMKAAAAACSGQESGNYGGPCFATTILSSQRYTFASGNTSIVFDPADPQYNYVPQAAKVALAVAQLDSTVASFLVEGLQWARSNTNGSGVAVIMPIEALSSFNYPGNSSPIYIYDGAAGGLGRRNEVVTGSPYCNGMALVHFADSSTYESVFSPFLLTSSANTNETRNQGNFHGGNGWPSTPFNGSGGGSNPYLIVAFNGSNLNWNGTNFPTSSCLNGTCSGGSLDLDPIPYTQPAAYYDATGNMVGPQANPFTLVVTNLYADPAHAGQWATRTVAGTQHWGTFSNAVNVLGTTVYQYVQQY